MAVREGEKSKESRSRRRRRPAKELERDPGCWRVDKGKKQREGMTEHARRQNLKKRTKTKMQALP